ncbi:serine hydrolase domain-containing protein [Glaciecola sp. SC05]|uniref:serine hydrolase domain-containing protein n=1 Tax=Glaciecola sp. SC05 TaxID=1987355 RepID=UPI003527E72C
MITILKWLGVLAMCLMIAAGIAWWAIGPDWRALLLDPPQDANVLFWSQSQRDVGFKMTDKLPQLIKSNVIEPSHTPRDLPIGAPLPLATNMDLFFEQQNLAGALILHKGQIRFERYGIGHSPDKRWTSFSVAKSLTSSLVGMALKDGYIGSLDDKVSQYIEGLKGSAYDDVTIRQLLTMTSGVKWNEDYSDPQSDVAKFNNHIASDGLPSIVSYMRKLPRAHPAGQQWHYSTGETNLIGILVGESTGRPLAQYLSEKIWQPFGMADKASWLLSSDGLAISGCCIQASLRDFARYGLFVLEDGKINGSATLPDGWMAMATSKQTDIGREGRGYGFQWWTFDDGSFTARGIFGQTIFIDPKRQLVVAFNGNWKNATEPELNKARFEFIDEVRLLLDEEAK